ncbi:hypothetical protein [Demequina sp. NBRC 110057]|uniref:hypothetical protein n=1 Tax=Demequina sp. NBRC 110057 TaxID=1570346 RepID=UPI000A0794A2|nr:hypothetical protein [Demequina sp. NBRC 110057]
MTVRTTALIAGVIGVLLLAAGLIADAQRPPTEVSAVAELTTAVVVYEPEMIAFAEDSTIGVEGKGDLVAVTARPADADAWLAEHEAIQVTGLPEWEVLATAPYGVDAATSASPSPSASPSAEASAASSDEPSASASPDASASPEPEVDLLADTSEDHWRDQWDGTDRLEITASDVAEGETLVVMSRDGSALASTDVGFEREVNDGWITPLIWWGAVLTVIGLIALILRFIDLRPAQAKYEEWTAKRQRTGDVDAELGTRRARRAAGEHLPEASLDEPDEPASAPTPDTGATPATGSTPATPSSPTEPGSATTPDPDTDTHEEGRS